ncbi:MAG: hypothetical protein ACXWQ5_19535, partial [Ktedonobacterales bacterium]
MDRMKDILEKLAKQNAAAQAMSGQDIPPTDVKVGTPARTHKTAGSHHASHAFKGGGPSRLTSKASKGAPPTERETGTNSDTMAPAARLHAVPRQDEQVATDVEARSKRQRPNRVQDMDMDRILELPARRRDAEVQPLPSRVAAQAGLLPARVDAMRTLTPRSSMSDTGDMGGTGQGSPGLEPIGNSMRGFLERLAERRRRRALSGERAEASQLAAVPKPPACPYCGGAGYLRLDVPVGHPSFGQPVPCKCKERELEERHRLEEERRLIELDRFFSLKPFS